MTTQPEQPKAFRLEPRTRHQLPQPSALQVVCYGMPWKYRDTASLQNAQAHRAYGSQVFHTRKLPICAASCLIEEVPAEGKVIVNIDKGVQSRIRGIAKGVLAYKLGRADKYVFLRVQHVEIERALGNARTGQRAVDPALTKPRKQIRTVAEVQMQGAPGSRSLQPGKRWNQPGEAELKPGPDPQLDRRLLRLTANHLPALGIGLEQLSRMRQKALT